MTHNRRRIDYLSKEYSTTHANSEELFITNSPIRREINKNNNKTQIKKEIHEVIYELPNKKIIYDEIENICMNNKFNKLCGNCQRQKVIAVITLYVLRNYNTKLNEEEHKLWKKYNLTWKTYARIVSNILRNMRMNSNL